MVKICFPGLYSHDRGTSSTWRCLWLENENACSQAILNIILTWMRRHLCACKHTWWDAFQQPSLEHSQNLFLTVPVTGFVLLNALVSQKEPKLALSGCSDRLHSLNTTSTDEKKKKSSNIPFIIISIYYEGTYLLVLTLLVQSGQVQQLSVYLGGLVRLHSIPLFSLHDPYVRMLCLPVCLSVCPPRTTYQHKGSSTEGC